MIAPDVKKKMNNAMTKLNVNKQLNKLIKTETETIDKETEQKE